MQLITPPLQKNNQGSEVKNLHYILFFLTQRLNDASIDQFFNKPAFQEAYKTDVFKQLYGSATTKLVNFLQEFLQVQAFEMGVVDQPTAEKFNELLRQFNGLDIDKPEGYPYDVSDDNESQKKFTITGKIMLANGKPADKITITAFNKNLRSESLLGEQETSVSGSFTITYEPVFPKSEYKTADVFFRLYDGKKEKKEFSIFDVSNRGKNILPDGMLFNAGAAVEVEIQLTTLSAPTDLSEFETIDLMLSPLLEETKVEELNENEEHQDFTFLSRETGLDKDKISRFALSHRLFNLSDISAEFWYGLTTASFYQDLSKSLSNQNLDTHLPTIIFSFFAVPVIDINEIFKQVFESHLIPSKSASLLPEWVEQFTAFIIQRITNLGQEDQAPFVKSLMNSAGLAKEKQEKFLRIYLRYGAFDEAFWKEVALEKGLNEGETGKLRFAHALTQLGGNNEKLVNLVASLPQVSNMRQLALHHNTSSLAALLTPKMLPDNVEGKTTKAKIKNYASTLQQQLFTTETSAVLQRMATVKELPIKDDGVSKGVAGFFNNQPEFNIRTTSIYNAIKSKDAFEGIAEKHQLEVISQLKTLQRVQAISPAHETVATLMKANISTAQQVTEMSESSFMTAFSKKMGKAVARQVYTNATNLKLRNEHALVSMKEAVQGSGIAFIDGNSNMEDRQMAFDTKAAENNFPVSWENLFGSADFCECGECTSVYSPAAYFVELLQYLRNNDLDLNAKGGQAVKPDPKDISDTVLEKLFRRRPDLGCLELTCANTNTILPYVDLVNEVMESFIVHLNAYTKSTLNPKEATIDSWNVEDETSGELLAQPQHINNDAYLIVKKAVYPFSLPYDRPVDMIRTFLEYLDTSRYELMKTFRAIEQHTISKDVMPEDTILPASPSPDPDEAKIPAFNKMVSDRAIDAEFLSITQEEYIILTKEAFLTKDYFNLRTPGITNGQYRAQIGVKAVPEYYGYTGNNSKADMLDTSEALQGGLTFVKKQFLKRTGLLYVDLVELLKTESLNPLYPKGKPLVILESIPFSYRFLQGLVDKSSADPEIRFKKLIEVLENPQNYIPGYDEMRDADPCKPKKKSRPAFRSTNIKQWVYCYFERIGHMIVLESNAPDCDCVEGQFIRSNGSDNIQIVDTEGQLFLTKECDLLLKRRDFKANVGHIDSMTGFTLLTDVQGNPVDISVLTDQNVVFKGNKGEIGFITQERLINQRNEQPFSCSQSSIDTCDLSKVRLKHLDGTDLTVSEYDKMHRFIRLWKKMGWTIDETDKSLVGLTADKTTFTLGFKEACDPEVNPKGFAEITPELIHRLVSVKKLLDKTGLELIRLLAFWGDISTSGEKSLYKRLFLTHNLLAIDNVFKADANGNYLTKPEKMVDHLPVLMAAFNVKFEEIDALVSVSDPLTLQSVSTIYRNSILAKLLHSKTADLKEVFTLFGDPFQDADTALDFFDKWDKLDDAGFSFAELNYAIQDIDNPLKPIKPSKNKIITLAKTIYDGLNAIDNTHPDLSLTDELTIKLLKGLSPSTKKEFLQKIATEELVRSKISMLFEQESVELIVGLLQGTRVYSASVPPKLVKTVDEFIKKFPHTTAAEKQEAAMLIPKVKYDFNSGALQVTGILTAKEQTTAKDLFKSKSLWKSAFDDISEQALYIFDDQLSSSGIFKKDLLNAKKKLLGGDIKNPDDPKNDTAPVKREYFLEDLLPFLREKLTEKFLIETLSGAAGLETDTTNVLISDVLEGVSKKKLMAIFKDVRQPPTGTGWQGYLFPVTDDEYTFVVKNTKKPFSLKIDGENILDEKFPLGKNLFISAPQKLKAGKSYLFEVSGLPADLGDINWSTSISPKSPIPKQMLLPMSALLEVEEGFTKLSKAAIVVNGFALAADEIGWLQDHGSDFDGLNFNTISLQHLLRIAGYTRLRDVLPASDLILIDFFKWSLTVNPATLPSEQVALLTGRKKEEIDVLIAPSHFALTQPKDFSNEINLQKLVDALFVYDKINMNPDLLFEWAKPVSGFAVCQTIAETIHKSIQARYKQEDWEQVVKPLNDQLREQQKQALIDYLLVQPDLITWGVIDADSLFEFFLIDVQMDACMQTSRLKQAISSVQLFVQRCFLGEEAGRGVPNDVMDRDRWKWMQRNPLWVANRKVFLWPENWILTNLRDDKSAFYKELESELLQKDINKQNVSDALKSYLYKVDEVANMKVVGLFIEESVAGKISQGDKIHVFASTRTAPFNFYYRCYKADERNWMPWEKVQLDIPTYNLKNENHEVITHGCYVIPVVFGKRLFVFFPQFVEKTKPNEQTKNKKVSELAEADPNNAKPITYWEIKMAWSEYHDGNWSKKQVCEEAIYHPDGGANDISLTSHPNADINRYSFVPVISSSNNYFYIFIFYDKTTINSDRYSRFLFMDGHLKKQTLNALTINTGYPNNFHYGSNGIQSQIHSLQKDSGNFGYEVKSPFFNDDSAGESYHAATNEVAGFYYPYSHALLNVLKTEDLSELFSFNLLIKDEPSTSAFNELIEAFGKEPSGISNELKDPYSLYNWELFFHIPVTIAKELSATQQFEEAIKWYHYVFDPTAKGTDPKRFWQFLPFKETNSDNFLENLFTGLQPNTPNKEINEWRNNPFQPHVIARSRPSAYMKWVVMQYIDNLIAWGDYLFKQDTIETLNYATQLYVLAGHILGPRPQMIPKRGKIKPETYNSLLDKWDAFGNAMVELELIAPFSNQTTVPATKVGSNGEMTTANIFGFASTLYFCIPNNPKLMGYWDTLADRLFKIRHCENIEGVFRMLPLWDPPIDPALLVAATAQGLSLDSVLNDLNTPLPNYRFIYLLQKAIDLCNEVKSLGNSLLSVLEKGDGEALAVLRAGHESIMHNLVMEVKKMQVEEANSALEGLQQNRRTTEYRLRHYLQLMGEDLNKIPAEGSAFSELSDAVGMIISDSGLRLISEEKEEMDKAAQALGWQIGSLGMDALSSLMHLLPDTTLSIMPLGIGVQFEHGGTNLGYAASGMARVLQAISSIYSYESTSAQRKAGFRRQLQDRVLQANLAGYECMQIDKQITSQQIRINISNQEITNQQKMIDHSVEVEEFLKNKYTNEELYKWMKGQIKTVYRQVYNLAYDWAKKAELVFRFERGLTSSNFIQYGYWDTSHEGLQSGEKLFLGLKQLEAAYHENRGYDFEVTKHISLQQLDPMALLELRETGKCEFSIPEVLFDMDFPGHFMRRIKSVALSIPCIAGPYTSVNATLRLQGHSYRNSSIATNKKDYLQKTGETDERFTSTHIPIDSIATSSGQQDSGVFELNFKDERYMPFEGAGAVSKWQLELPDTFRQFNYDTISDIILRINYTSKNGGDKLKDTASKALLDFLKSTDELSQREGLFAMFDVRNDFSNEWHNAFHLPPGVNGKVMKLGNLADRLPFYTKNSNIKNIIVKDIYFATDASFKITNLTLILKNTALNGSFEGPVKINKTTSLYHMSELKKTMDELKDIWSLKFSDKLTEPDKMLMVIRYMLN